MWPHSVALSAGVVTARRADCSTVELEPEHHPPMPIVGWQCQAELGSGRVTTALDLDCSLEGGLVVRANSSAVELFDHSIRSVAKSPVVGTTP